MLLIYLPVITSRCEYIFDLICKEEFGLEYKLTTDLELFKTYGHEKINYSFERINNEFFIKAYPLLFERAIHTIDPTVEEKSGTTVLFANDNSCNIGFDIFSAVFYMISRYEEYLPFSPDKYGRYRAYDSLAYQHKFLQEPLVDTWKNILKTNLFNSFSSLQFKPSSFKHIITYDIDIAYAFAGRNIPRLLGSTLKDVLQLRFGNIFRRMSSLADIKKDPWNVYDFLEEIIAKDKIPAIFFFLLAEYSRYDKNLSYRHPLIKKLIAKIKRFSEIGIHPSFKTSVIPANIFIETERLQWLSGMEVSKSRQHYLRFTLPGTYNHLINAGIKEDYSMGFADMPGFRAGTCKPFYFYDLQNERSTGLKIFPTTFMEGSFIDYLQVQPARALECIFQLIEEVKNVDGTFISIWHNHTISDAGIYKGWRFVHDKMIERVLLYA